MNKQHDGWPAPNSFRVWDAKAEEFTYPERSVSRFLLGSNGVLYRWWADGLQALEHCVMQRWIGLRDKKGAPIFIGDILKEKVSKELGAGKPCMEGSIIPHVKYYQVVEGEHGFSAASLHKYPFNGCKFWPHIGMDCLVIGNCFEIPGELNLEVSKQLYEPI